MLAPEKIQPLKPKLLLIQLVAVAMLIGILVLASLIALIADWENLNERAKLLNLLGGVTGIFLFGLAIGAPKLFSTAPHSHSGARQANYQPALGLKVAQALLIETILRYGLIASGITLNLMVFMIEPHLASCVVAGIGILILCLYFPRQSAMIAAIERRAASLAQHDS